MASNPSDPAPELGPPPAAPNAGHGQLERYGTVAVERRVKDDGRALILYTHRAPEPSGEELGSRERSPTPGNDEREAC